jgi:murein DD-endopeptidase MepM/ murein hydrolase activator NlpD
MSGEAKRPDMVKKASTVSTISYRLAHKGIAVTSIRVLKPIATLLRAIPLGTLGMAVALGVVLPISAPVSRAGPFLLHRTTQMIDPLPVTLAKWRSAPKLPRQRLTLWHMVSAEKHVSTEGNKNGFFKLLGSMTFIRSVLDEVDASRGEGGPYVALGNDQALQLSSHKIQKLARLTANLPLGIPLKSYELSSRFGSRIDPMDHQPAFHPGLDMEAPSGSGVYSTGAGTVTFTGSMEGYGRVVEIDHGYGVVTRYAHLHRILVAIGQNVESDTVIAEVGSTGRSTGPHLHYEIRVGGAATDPGQFIVLGHAASQLLRRTASEERDLGTPSPAPIQPDNSGYEFR